jgi:hypothetical protein
VGVHGRAACEPAAGRVCWREAEKAR